MKYILQPLVLVLLSLIILACGSTGSTEKLSSNITVSSTKSTLATNKKTMNIDLLLANSYSSKVIVKVQNLALNIAPCEVISSTYVPNEFTFTKSSNVKVQAELIFSEECTPTSYQLEGTTLITLDGETKEIVLDSKLQELNASMETNASVASFVASGPPSAISISYVSTGHDASKSKYEEKFAISVTDEYGNKVNTRPYISLGVIAGYAVDGRESSAVESSKSRRLYYGQSDIEGAIANGTVDSLGDEVANTTNFEDSTAGRSDVFKWVNAEGANSDKLVVFGKGKNYEAMGKWDFSKLNNSTLTLEDDYFGEFRSNLSYAIGRNYYQDQCTDDSREWLGTTDAESYQLDEEGTVIISYKYDYHLMGKDVLVWVNLEGYQADTQKNTRLGEVTKHTLLGQGLRAIGGTASLDVNETKAISYEIWHEGAPHVPYRNAHFGWRGQESNNCEIITTRSSNSVDARTCDNGWSREGRSYITFLLRASDKGCTFGIEDILVSDEF